MDCLERSDMPLRNLSHVAKRLDSGLGGFSKTGTGVNRAA